MATFQMLLRGLDGRTSCLRFSSSTLTGSLLQDQITAVLRIPTEALLIFSGTRVIFPHTSLSASSDGFFPSCSLLLRLRGGKGGFGSLLRGAATKAGQKKTSNFDACRDMSGRRLRHVNAEKKLKEWKAQAKERELEKAANAFLKKQVKQKEVESGCSQVMERFREETSRARDEVESAVTRGLVEAKKFGKRKIIEGSEPSTSSKRAHIWASSEIDVIDEGSEDKAEDAKEGSEDEGIEVEKVVQGFESEARLSAEVGRKETEVMGVFECGKAKETFDEKYENKVLYTDALSKKSIQRAEVVENEGCYAISCVNIDLQKCQTGHLEEKQIMGDKMCNESDFKNHETSKLKQDFPVQKDLNFEDFLHASGMEVLGLERLKHELQVRGLKCGGSLAERAGRLFLLKSTPLEKLDRKHFAKSRA